MAENKEARDKPRDNTLKYLFSTFTSVILCEANKKCLKALFKKASFTCLKPNFENALISKTEETNSKF